MTAARILVVDDEPDIRHLVQEILEDEGYEVEVADNGEHAREATRRQRPDLVLLDIWMPDVDGITLLKEWTEEASSGPVIMMSGHGTVETAVEATRLGAYDFIEKPLSLAKLLVTVERALEAGKHVREKGGGLRHYLDEVIEPVGKSALMRELREQAQRIAAHESPVLILGEAGSGKTCLGRWLHACSTRRSRPLVEIPSGVLAGDEGATDLFGAEEDGRVRRGRLDQADEGTLFLDEVTDLDQRAQASLVGVLQGRSYQREGGSQPVRADVRVIAATRADLEQWVRSGRFREDLYYQLNVVPLRVPPLREHVEDVPDLITYYVDYYVNREKLQYRRFTVAAQNRLRHYAWPGNVRELRNLVQRLMILGRGEDVDAEEVELALAASAVLGAEVPSAAGLGATLDLPLREAREHFERVYLQHQLKKAGGSVGQLAKLTGMERTNLYRKLKALGIDPREAE